MFSPKPTSFPSETFKKEAEDIECESLEALKQEAIDSSDCKFDVKQEDVESLLATEGKVMLPTLPSISKSCPPETIKKDSEDLDDVDYMIKQEEVDISDCESTIKQEVDECRLDNAKEIILYKCDVCPDETKRKANLSGHKKKHLNMEEAKVRSGMPEAIKKEAENMDLVIKEEEIMLSDWECTIKLEEYEITESSGTNNMHSLFTSNENDTKKIYCCKKCNFTAFTSNQDKTHRRTDKMAMYKCEVCPYTNKCKYSLKGHEKRHLNLKRYQCKFCDYQSINPAHFKYHLVIHKSPDEITMYKCELCHFQTKRKWSLKNHQKQHLSLDDIEHYECATCGYRTFNVGTFKRHLLVHKKPCEVTMFKCDTCQYQTKYRNQLKNHQKHHLSLDDVEHYECATCHYKTYKLTNFKRHLLVHKKPYEVTMFKCDVCPYQTKRKSDLKTHQKQHSCLEGYKCANCGYRTVRLSNFKNHLLVHKKLYEVTMFMCDVCPYQTKRKGDLTTHQKQHSSLEDRSEQYECTTCGYRTVRSSNFKQHMLVHKKPWEVTMFKCDLCPYQTKIKGNLKTHQKQHLILYK